MSRETFETEGVRLARHLVLQHGEITPSDLAAELPGHDHTARMTRAIDVLGIAHSRGLVVRTGRQRPGRYGVPEDVWGRPRSMPAQEGERPWSES